MLNEDYRDMLQCLHAEGVKFMLVGGYALAAHGHLRSTLDIDLWVMASADNAAAVTCGRARARCNNRHRAGNRARRRNTGAGTFRDADAGNQHDEAGRDPAAPADSISRPPVVAWTFAAKRPRSDLG